MGCSAACSTERPAVIGRAMRAPPLLPGPTSAGLQTCVQWPHRCGFDVSPPAITVLYGMHAAKQGVEPLSLRFLAQHTQLTQAAEVRGRHPAAYAARGAEIAAEEEALAARRRRLRRLVVGNTHAYVPVGGCGWVGGWVGGRASGTAISCSCCVRGQDENLRCSSVGGQAGGREGLSALCFSTPAVFSDCC